MKLALIRPNLENEATFPTQLGILTAILTESGKTCSVWDLSVETDTTVDIKSNLSQFDLLIISTSFVGAINPPKDAQKLKKALKPFVSTPKTLLVGDFPTLFPEFCFRELGADYIIPGDPEEVFVDCIDFIDGERSRPQGLWAASDSSFCAPNLNRNLSTLPLIDLNRFKLDLYPSTLVTGLGISYPLITSRGCNKGCSYCFGKTIWNKEFRARSISSVLVEIEYILTNVGITHFIIEDDNFLCDDKRVENLCNELLDRNLAITWECLNGVPINSLDSSLLSLMQRAGLRHIAFGIESLSQQGQKVLNKYHQKEQLSQLLNLCHDLNIITSGYFIVDHRTSKFPHYFSEVLKIKSLPLTLAHFSILQRYDKIVEISQMKRLVSTFLTRLLYLTYYLDLKKLRDLFRHGFIKRSKFKKIYLKLLRG